MSSFSTKKVKRTKAEKEAFEIGLEEGKYGTASAEDLQGFSTAKAPKPKATARQWSNYQQAIFTACSKTKESLVVKALAGTGKTTTVIEAIKHLDGKILLCAFNKRIAEELASRVEDGSASVMTLHGLGFRLVGRSYPGCDLDNKRGLQLAEVALNKVGGPKSKNYHYMVKDAADICKQIVPFIDVNTGNEASVTQVLDIGRGYGHLDRMDPKFAQVTGEAILETMRLAQTPNGTVDYTDMIYVPLHNPSTQGEYDVVIVDEAQDMNAAQLALAQMVLKKEGRLVVVGDQHQAIYGFRGADSRSMEKLQEKFKAKVLPLPVTYRCAKAIVDQANLFVPELEARIDAPQGDVQYIGYNRMIKEAKAGDFILSRVNASLLRLCLMFIKDGRKAVVEGRDIAKGLLNLISKMTFNRPTPVSQFLQALKVWKFKQIEDAAANHDEERAQSVKDQCEALEILAEDAASMDGIRIQIERLFDDTNGKADKIICSTVHKAKGLESDRVFILCDTFRGGWEGSTETTEENNLKYVAITRAKNVLSYVDHPSGPNPKDVDKLHAEAGHDQKGRPNRLDSHHFIEPAALPPGEDDVPF